MHELETIEGDLNIRSMDWIKADPRGIRYVRLGGYNGAPTAELVATPLGWVGQSWIMQPRRVAHFPSENSVEWAIHLLESAEAAGQHAPAWVPITRSDIAPGYNLFSFGSPDHPPRWAEMVNGHCLLYIEATGAAGAPRILVAVDGVLVAERGGEALVFDDIYEAMHYTFQTVT